MGPADSKPTLLVLASTYPRWLDDHEPGFVHELSRRLTDRFRVIVLCPHALGAAPREVLQEVNVVRYRYAPERFQTLVNDGGIVTNLKLHRWKLLLVPGFVLMQAWWTWRLCRTEKVDVVHAHWLIPQGVIAALLQLVSGRKIPFIVTSHGADLYALRGRALDAVKRFVLRRSSVATVVSSAMIDRLRVLGADTGKISVLPMGVDLGGRFYPDAAVERSAHEILFVGRLVEKKGVRYLLDAMPAVLKSVPGVRLTIAGFGPEEQALKEQVARLGLNSAVSFLGAVPQSELPALYRRAALYVAPFVQADSGDQEGLPVALMEAVACGCPAIVGDIAGIEDLLGDLKPEICVDARDVHELGSRIIDGLMHPQMSRARAQRMLESVSERVDWVRIAHGYADLLGAGVASQKK